MGERFTWWVVREGAVRGKGRYFDGAHFTDDFRQCDAARFTKRGAIAAAGTNRRPVRLITLSEQLRRAKKEIAALNEHVPVCHTAFHEGEDEGYKRGRADERNAVAKWMRELLDKPGPAFPSRTDYTLTLIRCLERADHTCGDKDTQVRKPYRDGST